MAIPAGMILLWHGSIVSIPSGYVLCDGNNGTPDLRNRFIYGASVAFPPGIPAGAATHDHTFTTDGHAHDAIPSGDIAGGVAYNETLQSSTDSGETEAASNLPPFYSLAYIMKT